jgi:tetratricopeptide (TPR) repeat protein
MGAVFSAVDESTGQRVALKRLATGASARASALFEREFYVLSSLQHPRIINVYDYGIDAAGPYYTMELLEGSDLKELSPVAPSVACRYLRDVASSLALLHARRLLHRDVSPRNVRTLPDGGCKLIDFGALTSFGKSEDLVGTPPAMPPEALAGEAMDQRADLFSLGALAYYLLTGRHAYPARKVSELSEAWLEKVPPPSRYAEGVSPQLDELVLALLSLDVLARPCSAAEVIGRLDWLGGLTPDLDERTARSYFVGASLVERELELARTDRRLSRARVGRGDAIFVDAPHGVGKTRFLGEVTLKAQLQGTSVLRVDAADHSGPFSTMRALVQLSFRLMPKVAARVFVPHAEVLDGAWDGLLSALEVGSACAGVIDRGAALAALPGVLEGCFRSVARQGPLLVAVDNVDRADAQSAALILALARASRSEALVVITTAMVRPDAEISAAVRAIRESGTAIRLRELSREGAVELVRTAFGDAPHVRRTATRLYGATQGNPQHCMRLLQRWVETGLIRYVGGTWSLPLEIPAEELERASQVVTDRLRSCSGDARCIAATLAVLDRPAPLEWCVSLEGAGKSSREIIASLEELVRAEVLSESAQGYRFSDAALRASALADLEPQARAALQIRVGEALQRSDSGSSAQIAVGLHFIRGGDETRGAELVEQAARRIIAEDPDPAKTLSKSSEGLEAALHVYRRSGRGSLSLLGLLVPLVLASYEISPAFAMRYGKETISRLERALGLSPSCDGQRPQDFESLAAALGAAPVLEEGETKTDATPDVVTLVSWLLSSVMTLVAVSSAVVDHAAEEQFSAVLRPFEAFGPAHPAAAAYDFCRLIVSMTEDRLAHSHAGWSAMLARLDELSFPPQLKRRLRRGALYALGVLETQRDDDSALSRIAEFEKMGGSQDTAIANQLRFLFHGFRGDIQAAERHRELVEAYAVQNGSAWQVEIWSTSTASAVYSNTRDIAGNKRAVEQLERLKKMSASLELFWERAVAGQHLLAGAGELAAEMFARTLARSGPRERVGWATVRGGLARALNLLGRHDEAKSVCEETMALSSDDFEYVAMTLLPRIELCRALAGLGDFASARTNLEELLRRYAPNENPVTLGAIHRTFAEVAMLEGDAPSFERHLAAMRACFQPTKNPALIAQSDQLRNSMSNAGGFAAARIGVGTFATTAQTFAQSVLASCEGSSARKQRVLELTAARAGIDEAWLFTLGQDAEPMIASRLGASEAPRDLLSLVKTLFEEVTDDGDETAFIEASPHMQTTALPVSEYRLLPLTVIQGQRSLLVGTIAIRLNGVARPVSHDFLQGVAAELFQSGDITTVRTDH